MSFKIKRIMVGMVALTALWVASNAVLAQSLGDFTPRWAKAIESYNGYYELSNEELSTVYKDLERFNALYDQQGEDVFDIAFYPDLRGKRFYEITPYSDSYGRPIDEKDTVKKTITELRYVLNGNSLIKLADDSPINVVLNLMPKQDTNIVFARTSDTPFFKKKSNICLISYNARLDSNWDGRKEFFDEAKPYASKVKFYDEVPDVEWRNFIHHVRAAMCVHPEVASWIIEPPGLVLDLDLMTRKNKAFSFVLAYAALASARDGYTTILPKLTEMFKLLEESGTPVFKMKLLVADLSPKSGKMKTESNIAYPFTPYTIIEKAGELDYMSYATMQELSDAVFGIAVAAEFDSYEINNKWLTEEFLSYRMGF